MNVISNKPLAVKKRLAEIYRNIHESHASAYGDGNACSDPSVQDMAIAFKHDTSADLYKQAEGYYKGQILQDMEYDAAGFQILWGVAEELGDYVFNAAFALGQNLPRPFAGDQTHSPEHLGYAELPFYSQLNDFYGQEPIK